MIDIEVFNCNANRSPAHNADGNADHEQVWIHEFGEGKERSTVLLWQGPDYSRKEYEAKSLRQETNPYPEPQPTRPSDAQRLAALVEALRNRALIGVALVNGICRSKHTPGAPTYATEEGGKAIARRDAEEAMWRGEVEWIDAILLAHGFGPEAEVPEKGEPHET